MLIRLLSKNVNKSVVYVVNKSVCELCGNSAKLNLESRPHNPAG